MLDKIIDTRRRRERGAIDKRELENLIITKMYLYRTVREN